MPAAAYAAVFPAGAAAGAVSVPAPELRQELQLFLGSAEFFETIFLYQLALVDYIYTGRLHFLGTVIDVRPRRGASICAA